MININIDNINHITSDSRKVTANSIFVAVSGLKDDGHKYIEDAIAKGCKIIICSKIVWCHFQFLLRMITKKKPHMFLKS